MVYLFEKSSLNFYKSNTFRTKNLMNFNPKFYCKNYYKNLGFINTFFLLSPNFRKFIKILAFFGGVEVFFGFEFSEFSEILENSENSNLPQCFEFSKKFRKFRKFRKFKLATVF